MPRGFTLIELLVVVLLIVMITAIVGPLAISEIGRTSMKEAERQVEAAAMLARADAQRRGAVVQLLARPADELRGIGVELVSIDLTGEGLNLESDAQGEGSLDESAGTRAPTTGNTTGDGAAGVREKSILTLPAGVQMRSALRQANGADGEGSPDSNPNLGPGNVDADDSFGERSAGGSRALLPMCVFFPDGQIVASVPRYLVSRSGRGVSIQINRWTGRVTATPVEPAGSTDESTKEKESAPKAAKSTSPSAFVPEEGGGE